MRSMKRKLVIAIIFLLFTLSCDEIKLNVWKDDNYVGGPFKKVFVIVALNDPTIKNRFEKEFAKQMKIHKTDGAISSDFFSCHFTADRESIIESIREVNAEAILIVRLEKFEKGEDQYLIPSWYYDWYECYRRSVAYVRIPKYKDENFLVLMEATLYDTNDERLIWFAQSRVSMIACDCTEIIPFVKAVVDRISADKLIR
jgi:hypothetical protein